MVSGLRVWKKEKTKGKKKDEKDGGSEGVAVLFSVSRASSPRSSWACRRNTRAAQYSVQGVRAPRPLVSPYQ